MSARINYKDELESASRNMILVHEPDTLIRMILRTLVRKVRVKHACMLLHDRYRDTYVLTVSNGARGLKIPPGFARMDPDTQLIRAFSDDDFSRRDGRSGIIVKETLKRRAHSVGLDAGRRQMLSAVVQQMEIFDAIVAVPTFYGHELLGLLLLGKRRGSAGFSSAELNFFGALASSVAMAIRNAQLFKDLQDELAKKRRLFLNTTVALTAAIDAKDHYTHGHTTRVTNLTLLLAREMGRKGIMALNDQFYEHLQIAGLLHDIGKIGIPEAILNKPGPLDPSEQKRMQEHPLVGVAILEPIKELEDCVLGVKYHHERYDGTGYPERLKGSQIPLIASIISVADAFDAMITDRPYRKGLTIENAIGIIRQERARQFDPLVSDVLIELYLTGKV